MAVFMYIVSLDFMACSTLSYLPWNTNMRVLRTHDVEETVETLKRRQLTLNIPRGSSEDPRG